MATLTGSVDGIFLTSHLGLRQVVLEGDVMPDTGGGTLDALGPVAVSSNRVAFLGYVSGGTVSDGLFLWDHGRITRLVSAGDPAVAGENFGSLVNAVPAGFNAHLSVTSSPAFVAPVEGPTILDGLFFARANGSVTPVLLFGDPTPLGGVVEGLTFLEPITRIGNSVILEAAFSAASGSSVALVRAKP